jgi:hypothetical protein
MASSKGHINQALTNYTAGIAKGLDKNLIGDIVAPPVGVQSMSDAFWVMGDDSLRIDSDVISLTSDVPRVVFNESDSSYKCQEYGMETVLKKAILSNADRALNYEQSRIAGLTRKIKLALEERVSTAYTGGTITQTSALAVADRWDLSTGDPVNCGLTAKQTVRAAIGVEPNTLFMGPQVYDYLALHPQITDRLAGLVAGVPATEAQIATVLGVDRVVVGRAMKVTSKEGAAKTRGYIWGKIACFAYIDPATGQDMEGAVTPFQRFRFDGFMPEFATYEYDEGPMKSVRGVYACYDIKAIAASAAYLFTTVVS